MNTEEFFEKFGAIFELDDIESIEEDGYENCYARSAGCRKGYTGKNDF